MIKASKRPDITYHKTYGWGVLDKSAPEDFMVVWPIQRQWLDDNVKGGYKHMRIIQNRFYFKEKSIALLFKMIFG